MAGLVPAIHELGGFRKARRPTHDLLGLGLWMAGTSPAMTVSIGPGLPFGPVPVQHQGMQAFLASFIGDPYDWGGRYMAVYLAFPIVATAVLALRWRHVSKTVIAALATVTSATAFIFLYCLAYGVHSTIGIGFMFALVVHSLFSAATVVTVRAAQSRLTATSPPAA